MQIVSLSKISELWYILFIIYLKCDEKLFYFIYLQITLS